MSYINQIAKVLGIYSGRTGKEMKEEILTKHEEWIYATPEITGVMLGLLDYHVPVDLYAEILRLGRRITDEEIEIIRFAKDKGLDVELPEGLSSLKPYLDAIRDGMVSEGEE